MKTSFYSFYTSILYKCFDDCYENSNGLLLQIAHLHPEMVLLKTYSNQKTSHFECYFTLFRLNAYGIRVVNVLIFINFSHFCF